MSLDFRQLGMLEQQKWPKTSFFAVNSVFSERACELKVKFISPPGRGVIDRAEFDCLFFQRRRRRRRRAPSAGTWAAAWAGSWAAT